MSSFKIHTISPEDEIFDGCICYTNFIKENSEYEQKMIEIKEKDSDEKIEKPKYICKCTVPKFQTFHIGFSKNNEDYF